MLKAVLLASCIILAPSIAVAQAAVAEPEDQVSFSIGAATGYVIESQAFEVEGSVVNAGVDYQVTEHFSVNAWGQYGEDDLAKEIDLAGTLADTINGVDVSMTAGAYFYPAGGSDTIYLIGVAASIPLGPVALDLTAERYMGGFKNTTLAIAISGSVNDTIDVTFGKAFNTGDINPWFVGASVPVGRENLGIHVGVRAVWGADEGAVLEITRSF